MESKKLYRNLAIASALIGLGVIAGHNISASTNNNALWVGGILLLVGAIFLGMSIAVPKSKKVDSEKVSNK